jgi:two-component system chemotaxis sensor kinase CheA
MELDSWLERFDRQALAGLEQAERELVQTHEKAGRLRLLPASALFDYLGRTCRDAAVALGKSVRFEASGGEQRLDGPVLAALQEALQHVVRNAVAHGIEAPAGRQAAGKAAQGSVHLSVQRRAGRILFTCADDGQGIDVAAVRRAAQAAGKLPAMAPDPLSLEAAQNLLLRGGLSTSSQVTELAGRGLGLDVLRVTVERLKGQLTLRNRPGLGLEVELSVPATLATFPALAVECGGLAALIPFDAIHSALSLQSLAFSRGPEGDSVLIEGQLLPFAPLAACLGLESPLRGRAGVVLQGAGALVALGVDRILGVREAVVLPLPDLAPRHALAAGACLDAAGDPSLLLDPEGLVRAVQAVRGWESARQAPSAPLLVIDDSLTTRMLEQSILETAGYEVDLAVSAEEGLLRARERRYGLILVDVEMPGMDGFEFLESLNADPALRGTPAILVSSRNSAEDFQRGQAVGAKDYITKGEFDQSRLLGRIRELLG